MEDMNTENCMQMLFEQFTLHPYLRQQYIYSHDTNPVAAAYSAADSSLSLVISHDVDATRNAQDVDPEELLCAICYENISCGQTATKLPCNHIFHRECTIEWFRFQVSCPQCRYDFQ